MQPAPSKDDGWSTPPISARNVANFAISAQQEDLRLDDVQRSWGSKHQSSIGRSYHSLGRQRSQGRAQGKSESTFRITHPEMWEQCFKAEERPAEKPVASEVQVGVQLEMAGLEKTTGDAKGLPALTLDDHLVSVSVLEERYGTSATRGLSVKTALMRLQADGKNVLSPPKERPIWSKFLLQLIEGFNPLLWLAAVLCFVAYYPLTYQIVGGIYNLALSLFLVCVILISAMFNFSQEWRSSQLLSKFKSLMGAGEIRTLREGQVILVAAVDLVVGDIVFLQAGDKVPADCRVIATNQAKVDKAALTGESLPVSLSTESTDDNFHHTRNLAFLGTSVTEGNFRGLVYRCGDDTLMGSISRLTLDGPPAQTSLHKEVNAFATIIALIAGAIGAITVLFYLVYIRGNHDAFMPVSAMLVNVISVVVAFVPEGLPMCVTLSMSLIAAIMSRENVLVKRLGIIDTLGSVSTICSDKTGTLTQNVMTASHLGLPPTGQDSKDPMPSPSKVPVLGASGLVLDLTLLNAANELPLGGGGIYRAAALCTRTQVVASAENLAKPFDTRKLLGDPTEQALFRLCDRLTYGLLERKRKSTPAEIASAAATVLLSDKPVDRLRAEYIKVGEIPFNSRNKWQASVHVDPSSASTYLLVIKGAPERVLDFCSTIVSIPGTTEASEETALTDALHEQVLQQVATLGALGERVLGFAQKTLHDLPKDAKFTDEDILKAMAEMQFLGVISINDPPRHEVPRAIEVCKQAGIRTVMVTGDSGFTGAAIARKVGIFTGTRPIMKGSDLLLCKKIMKPPEDVSKMPAMLVEGDELAQFEQDHWDFTLASPELVFARTTPAMKLQIANRIQATGQRIAMTGDGVNDAPALRAAEVGIAMGIAGTEVAKEAADIILMDDNFASIVKGIERGRLVFENLKKVIAYLLPAGTFSEWWALFGNVFLGMPLPLSSFLMIIVSLSTDVVGSLSLVYEEAESDIMMQVPRNPKTETLVDLRLVRYSYFQLGIWDTLVEYGMYFLAMWEFSGHKVLPRHLFFAWEVWSSEGEYAGVDLDTRNQLVNYGQSAYFVGIVMNQLWNVLVTGRTRRLSVFQHSANYRTFISAALEIAIVAFFIYVPACNALFLTVPLPAKYLFIPLGVTFINTALQELIKFGRRRSPLLEKLLGW